MPIDLDRMATANKVLPLIADTVQLTVVGSLTYYVHYQHKKRAPVRSSSCDRFVAVYLAALAACGVEVEWCPAS